MDNTSGSFIHDLPSSWQTETVSAQTAEPLIDTCTEVEAQLDNPTGALALRDLCSPTSTVTIVCDALPNAGTRAALLSGVLSQLERAGVAMTAITVLIAAKPGDAITASNQAELLGLSYAIQAKVAQHDPDDVRELDDLGHFEGVPLSVNYRAAEANVLVALSVMQLDIDSFDLGSARALTTGLMSASTARELQETRFLADQIEPPEHVRPLFERVVREGARRAGLIFVIDAIDDSHGRMLAVRAGTPNAVNDALMTQIAMMREARVSSPSYDVMVVDAQQSAQRGLFGAAWAAINVGLVRNPVLARGGSMILPTSTAAGAASDDMGEDIHDAEARAFFDSLSNASSPDQVIAQLRGRSLRPGEQRAYLLAHVMQRHRVIAAGPHSEYLARSSHFLSTTNVHDAAELAESFAGPNPRALVVQHAEHSVPVFTGVAWDNDPFEDALVGLID